MNFTVCTLKVKATGESIIDERGRETGTHSHSAGEIGNEDEEEEEEDQRQMIELGQVGKREERKKYWYRLSTDNSTIVASAAVHPDFLSQ